MDDSHHDCGCAADYADAGPPLDERATIAARAELRGERTGILGATGQATVPLLARAQRIPERWSLIYVMERMEEGFRMLARLPMATRPRGYINSMPIYLYDRGDLNSQLETYELERMTQLRNRVRIPPSPAEIARMEEALYWPTAYLSGAEFHHVARAVNLGSLWAAFEADVDKGLRRIKVTRRAFNARKLQGLRIITRELIRRGTNSWSFAAGSQGIINGLAVEIAARGFGELTATAWVAHGAAALEARYGITTNSLALTFELKRGDKFDLQFGALSPAQYPYARVILDGEPWVFEFSTALFELVSNYLTIPATVP